MKAAWNLLIMLCGTADNSRIFLVVCVCVPCWVGIQTLGVFHAEDCTTCTSELLLTWDRVKASSSDFARAAVTHGSSKPDWKSASLFGKVKGRVLGGRINHFTTQEDHSTSLCMFTFSPVLHLFDASF